MAQIDWRQLQRWGISEARVPSTTVMRFRAPSFWGLYKGYIASAIALMLIQSALIGGLLLQRARRQRTELALRENQATLEASDKQISDSAFAGNFTTASAKPSPDCQSRCPA